MVARVDRVDRVDRQVAQILAPVGGQRQLRRPLGLGQHLLAEDMRNFVAGDRDHAERARRKGVPDTLDHLGAGRRAATRKLGARSEEHTSVLQSLMRISYAVFCLKKKKSM